MKRIKSKLYQFLMFALFILISCNQKETGQVKKILVITGGHDFEQSFYQIFDSFTDIQYDSISQPGFNIRLSKGIAEQYDALVFYDMWQDISNAEKGVYLEMVNKGKGIVFLHHSLVSYQHWDEFEKIIGGKYIETDFYDDSDIKGSTYTEDITLEIKVVDKNHPVTKNIADFSIYDEGYQSLKISPDVHPLLSTLHPDCAPVVAWTNSYGNSKIVYILLGHGHQAHENDNFRKLIHNAVHWVGKSG